MDQSLDEFNGGLFEGGEPEKVPEDKPVDKPPRIVVKDPPQRVVIEHKDQPPVVIERKQPLPENVARHEDAAHRALQQGDTQTALEHIQAAREAAPEDKQLELLEKLVVRKVQDSDPSLLKKQVDSLAAGQVDSLEQMAILATPIAFGAARPVAPEIATGKARDPFHPDAAQEAALKMRLRDFSAADVALTEKLASDPKDWRSWRDRAIVRLKLKRPAQAKSDAMKARELAPSNSSVLRVLALALSELGDLRAAVDELSLAVAAEPRDARAWAARADLYGRLGDKEAALADMKQAAALDPQFEELYAELAGGRRGVLARFSQRTATFYGAAASLALLLISYAFFRRRAPESLATPRPPMRLEDRMGGLLPQVPHGFTLVRQVGQGGMGVVYEATDSILQRRVALKKMRPEIAMDPRERRRFLKEARTVAALKHPHIVEIHQVIENDESLYLVFEFVEGRNLSEVVDEDPLSPAAALRLGRQVAEALDYAHASGVIHQDLKPSNVMVAAGYAKVMDFGIARNVNATMSTVTRNQVVGTPAYMAPEQEQAFASQASDQYSLALCLYEMLSGKMAFPVNATVFQKIERQYTPLSAQAKVGKAVDGVFHRALDPDPAKRFPSALAFIAELERSLLPS